uniref:Fatty acid binding protein n=1 Tax=Branchiostoma belcheri tsingtauense TaxID=155462 RepID=Q19AS0_BRABE|nr:fatty acid binding protein [Branchiostoma belcheri tsingtauense]
MPFPVDKFCGTWKHGSHSDNYLQMMEKFGMSAEMLKKIQESTFPMNASLVGDKLTFKVEFEGKTYENNFTLGVEGEEEDATSGKKRKVTYTIEGDHLVSVYPDPDGKVTSRVCRHFDDDDTIHTDIKAGDVEAWTKSKRC